MAARSLSGKQILVIEDEYFIASDLSRALRDAGAEVVGPVGDLDLGRALAASQPIDAAVLDVKLEGASSFPIVQELTARNIPVMLVTGYDDWALPEAYRSIPRVGKPFSAHAVIGVLETLLGDKAGK